MKTNSAPQSKPTAPLLQLNENEQIAKAIKASLEENEFVQVQLREEGRLAKELGFDIETMPNDGNCMYYAFLDQLKRNNINYYRNERGVFQLDHHALRKIAIDHLIKNKNTYEFAIPDNQNFDRFIEEQKKDKVWAEQLEILALSKEFGVNAVILKTTQELGTDGTINKIEGANVNIYLIHSLGNHYNSLVLLSQDADSLETVKTHVDNTHANSDECETSVQLVSQEEFDNIQLFAELPNYDNKISDLPEKYIKCKKFCEDNIGDQLSNHRDFILTCLKNPLPQRSLIEECCNNIQDSNSLYGLIGAVELYLEISNLSSKFSAENTELLAEGLNILEVAA